VQFQLAELAAVVGGRLVGPDRAVEGVSIDSRTIGQGALFVPVVAERDGHEFVGAALAAGAGGYLTAAEPQGGSAVVVPDTVVALAELGRWCRQRITGPVVGITGSVGKTSTKDLCRSALGTAFVTAASERSFNNELGVPLTLANAAAGTEVAVLEMGARGVGHIAMLCSIARPTIGVVLCVGAAHLELFGSLDGVAQGKGELVETLPAGGTAVFNHDDPRVMAMRTRTEARVLTFGRGPAADLSAMNVELDDELRPRFRAATPWGLVEVALGVRGAHNVGNALAALAAAGAAGVPVEQAAAALGEATLSPWRMELHRLASGAVILNDAYNANPMSMRAALESLVAMPGERHVAVLGQMAELGPDGPASHREIGELAAHLGVEVISVGVAEYGGCLVADPAAATGVLGPLGDRTVVLLKASRVVGLESLMADLMAATA
jgi:UDP-N-acetylmuramoyl-tripeptide--D-alanyl-D-alanine ligase